MYELAFISIVFNSYHESRCPSIKLVHELGKGCLPYIITSPLNTIFENYIYEQYLKDDCMDQTGLLIFNLSTVILGLLYKNAKLNSTVLKIIKT